MPLVYDGSKMGDERMTGMGLSTVGDDSFGTSITSSTSRIVCTFCAHGSEPIVLDVEPGRRDHRQRKVKGEEEERYIQNR